MTPWAHRSLPRAPPRQPVEGTPRRARGPPVDYGDKPAAAKRSLLTPPRWSLFAPPLTRLGSHKAKAIGEAIRAAGARLWFLPPYSPDLNPIEQTFAKIKHWMRMAQNRTMEETWRYVGRLVATITPNECANYFKNAGYASDKM